MERKIVHVVGTGTIGEPLIGLLCDYQDQLGIDEVTFHKNSALKIDKSKVVDLQKRGARLAVDEDKENDFKKLKIDSDIRTRDAIERASVVIDCTSKGVGHENKLKHYENFANKVKGFIAQGSEDGFGKKYARGINDSALSSEDKFIQIVSCNTHNIACLTKTISFNKDNTNYFDLGDFLCIRRANDFSQEESFIPAPKVGIHKDEKFGTHHAKDAHGLFNTIGENLNLYSSEMKVNSQYMHILRFKLSLNESMHIDDLKNRLIKNPLIALTTKDMTSSVFSFGRDHGHYGRILNQTVIVEQSLNIKNGNEITGFCFTPQDSNSILSSISATEWFLYPHSYEDKIQCLSNLFYNYI